MDLKQKSSSLQVVLVGIFFYTLFFTVLSFLRYEAFSYSDFDFALFSHECWKALHGSGEISLFQNTPIWGNGLELISIVTSPFLLVSFFNPKGLLFFQALALGLGALPVYLIARNKGLSERVCVGLAFSYLCNPSIWYANLYEYNPLIYSTLTLLMAFYFFQVSRFKPFMIFIVLSLINRADLGIVTFMFGVYALFSRRPWKWVIAPSLLSFLWVAIGLLVVIPAFKNVLSYDSYYPQFGNGFGEVIKNMIFHPEILYKSLVTSENGRYFYEILLPVGFLSLPGLKEFLICALSLLQHLASVRPSEHTILFHYTSTITPFVYISAAYGLARLVGGRELKLLWYLPIIFSLTGNLVYGPLSRPEAYKAALIKNDMDDYKKQMLKKIPADAPVVSSFEFSSMLSTRYYYYSFHYIATGVFRAGVPYETPENIEYAVVNFEDPRLLHFCYKNSDQLMAAFLNRFGIVDMAGTSVLFKKGHPSDIKMYEIRDLVSPREEMISTINGLKLNEVQTRKALRGKYAFLDIDSYWTIDAPIDDAVGVLWVLRGPDGKEAYRDFRFLGYGVYPTKRWVQGKEVIDHHRLLLPKSLKAGEYRLYMALFSEKEGNRIYKLGKIDRNTLVRTFQPNIMVSTFKIP